MTNQIVYTFGLYKRYYFNGQNANTLFFTHANCTCAINKIALAHYIIFQWKHTKQKSLVKPVIFCNVIFSSALLNVKPLHIITIIYVRLECTCALLLHKAHKNNLEMVQPVLLLYNSFNRNWQFYIWKTHITGLRKSLKLKGKKKKSI